MDSSSTLRTAITVAMNLLVVAALVLAARMVVQFFGVLAAQPWGRTFVALTDPFIIDAVSRPIKTPYGGVFSIAVAATIVLVLVAEWLLSLTRGRI